MRHPLRRGLWVAVVVALLAGCGQHGTAVHGHSSDGARRPVRVLYAGSLVTVMERSLGPKFSAATGYRFRGEAKGSQSLAHEIKGEITRADVFLSADPGINATLTGNRNGDWVSWYATFASSPLVLGYNPQSRFASDLKSMPWQQVIGRPGFRLGRTDPTLDPKGKLSVRALEQVGLGRLADDDNGVFPEQTLVGRLQSGQLDAGFLYASEADEHQIPTIALDPVQLGATYTVTVLNRAPDPAGAAAFVRYLLGVDGSVLLRRHGMRLRRPPLVSGDRDAVPRSLRPTLSGG